MKKLTCFLAFLLLCTNIYSQQKENKAEIAFEMGESVINRELNNNDAVLCQLVESIKDLKSNPLVTINKVVISSSASPESGKSFNFNLTEERNKAIIEFLKDNGIEFPESILEINSLGINWDLLNQIVSSSNMEYKDDVLYIINNVDEETWGKAKSTDRWLSLTDSRKKHLMNLKQGSPYKYMAEHYFPLLRKGEVVTIYYESKPEPVKEEPVVEKPIVEEEPVAVEEPMAESTVETKPLLALKTNLLYDAVSVINAEIEIPFGNRVSIAGEWIFPWWTCDNGNSNSKRNRIQILNGNIEFKYWLGDRTSRPVMTGWYAGVYGGLGKYDLEYNAEGYQGDFYSASISGGYAHTINKKGNLRMEYSLGLGYFNSDYKYYNAYYGSDNLWHPIRSESGNYTWIGPTKAKISLVWLINSKIKKGGVK